MKLFGSLRELVATVFRKNSQEITLRPNQAVTYVAATDVQLAPTTDTTQVLVEIDATQTLTNKTISGASNTISNVSLTTGVTGVLPASNGGTGVANNNAATLTRTGNFDLNLTTTGATALTLPTTGTVATLAGAEALTNKTLITVDNLSLNGNTVSSTTGNLLLTGTAQANLTGGTSVTIASTAGQIQINASAGSNILETSDTSIDVSTPAWSLAHTTASLSSTLKLLEAVNNGTSAILIKAPTSLAADRAWTFPDAAGSEFTGTTATQTLTNKTLTSPSINTQMDFLAQGEARFQDTTGGQYAAIKAPGTIATSYTLTLPVDDGVSSQVLTTDGSGVLSWTTPSSGSAAGEISATDADRTLTSTDNRDITFTGFTTTRTITLPTTGITAGDVFTLKNTQTSNVAAVKDMVVAASGGQSLTVANGANLNGTVSAGFVRVRALVSTPTTAANWLVEEVYEKEYLYSTVWRGTSSTNASASVTHRLSRHNHTAVLTIPYFTFTASGDDRGETDTAAPVRFRVGDSMDMPVWITNATNTGITGAYIVGMFSANTNGKYTVFRDGNRNNFTNGSAGIVTSASNRTQITYNIINT